MDQYGAVRLAGAGGTAARERPTWTERVREHFLGVTGTKVRRRSELVAALNEITAVVSSRLSVEGVLQTVVDETKTVVECGKAVLCRYRPEDGGSIIDAAGTVVRGSREEFPEEWWLPELEKIAREVMAGETVVHRFRWEGAWMACAPISVRDRSVGLLAAINPASRRFTDDQLTLLAILGAFAGASIENAKLVSESQYSLLASERNRIAQEMHDGLAQALFSASLALEVCKKRLDIDPEGVAQQLDDTQKVLSASVSELRRYIYDLRPASLDRLGLVGAIESTLEEAGHGRLRSGLTLEGKPRPLSPAIESCVYRIAQESIANAVKHAGCRSVRALLQFGDDAVELAVVDDGRGFEVRRAVSAAEHGDSIGLRSIRDRVQAQGGRMRIDSTPGAGTQVWVRIPC